MTTATLDLTKYDSELLEGAAKLKGMTPEQFADEVIAEALEDYADLIAYHEGYLEYVKNPVTYTLDEVIAELGD